MNASSAYALGFYGQNTTTGVMDSGAWLGNPDLDTPRITATHVTGVYGSSGNRYPQSIYATIQKGVVPTAAEGQPFTEGEEFDVKGDYTLGLNDAHGTQVTGVINMVTGLHLKQMWSSEIQEQQTIIITGLSKITTITSRDIKR